MTANDLVRNTESTEYFHQTSMPDSTSETIHSFEIQEDERDQSEMDDHITCALKECLEEIDIKVRELFKKIVSNEYVEIPLGRLAREAIGEAGAKDFLGKILAKVINKIKAQGDEDVVGTRDISIDDEVLNQKLERFKVKTVNIGGVVKEGSK